MGTTGSSAKVAMNSALPEIISGIREFATVPLAVGFGVATREHFQMAADAGADGVVIGSRLVSLIKNSPKGDVAKNVENFCLEISLKGQPVHARLPHQNHTMSTGSIVSQPTHEEFTVLPHRFGQFGGQYVPEALFDCLVELEEAHQQAMNDPSFWKEFEGHYNYMNRPSNLFFAEKLTQKAGGAKIWLKREDL
jgi:tryptophan synthase